MTTTTAPSEGVGSTASVLVVGASLAGLSTVRTLREGGHVGPIEVVGAEAHLPYDRPPLSKGVLSGEHASQPGDLLALGEAEGVGWRLGTTAAGLERTATGHRVILDDGERIAADVVVAATGARARRLIGDHLDGVHTLRTLDDALALRQSLARSRRVVVVGGGFIGSEVAATVAATGTEVVVVEATLNPGAQALGPEVAEALQALHRRHGVELRTGIGVDTLDPAPGTSRVAGVTLSDGERLSCETVVVGIGAVPVTEWAAASGITVDRGFLADDRQQTSIPGVYAVGDCARVLDPATGWYHRDEHWGAAVAAGRRAGCAVLGVEPPPRRAPYLWSDLHGVRLQVCGRLRPGLAAHVVDGSLDSDRFVVCFGEPDDPEAVVALDAAREFTRHRKQLDRRLAAVG